jgi:hypothetical protein
MTDVLLLGLGCIFLYWSVKWPWQWYRETQAAASSESALDDAYDSSIDDAVHGDVQSENDAAKRGGVPETNPNGSTPSPARNSLEEKRSSASQSLRRFEVLAFVSCFLSPVAVACLLHVLRPHLSRPSGGLVSNSNLTLFVLAAEVRPVLHLCRLIEQRTLYWQRIVSSSSTEASKFGEIFKRIESLELQRKAETAPQEDFGLNRTDRQEIRGSNTDDAESLMAAVKQALQLQIDALNRAVRRYEKRSAAQATLLDARIRHVDGRSADALALAATAMRDVSVAKTPKPKRPGLVGNLIDGALSAVGSVVGGVVDVVLFPWRLIAGVGGYFAKPIAKRSRRQRLDSRVLSAGMRGGRSLAP